MICAVGDGECGYRIEFEHIFNVKQGLVIYFVNSVLNIQTIAKQSHRLIRVIVTRD